MRYIIKEFIGEEERTSQLLFIYNGIHIPICFLNFNDDASPFIEKTRVASYEITKLSLIHVLKFHELRSFQTRPLHRYAYMKRYSALSLRSAPLG